MIKKSNLKKKRALIVGATGSIGSAVSKKMAQAGVDLLLIGRNINKLELLCPELSEYGVRVDLAVVDLSSIDSVNEFISSGAAHHHIDILVNAAGVYPIIRIDQMSADELIRIMNINLNAPYLLCSFFSKKMIGERWGRIVNIGSSSAYSGYKKTSAYCASKHGLLGMSRAMHDELKEFGVRVYCISPSSTQGQMGLLTPGQDYSTFLDPEEVAEYVMFAISINGNAMSEEILIKRMIVR